MHPSGSKPVVDDSMSPIPVTKLLESHFTTKMGFKHGEPSSSTTKRGVKKERSVVFFVTKSNTINIVFVSKAWASAFTPTIPIFNFHLLILFVCVSKHV